MKAPASLGLSKTPLPQARHSLVKSFELGRLEMIRFGVWVENLGNGMAAPRDKSPD
jgi:hypothetical protein